MWAKFKLWILREEIRRYHNQRNLADLLVEIEFVRQRIFYEDNHFDRMAYYQEEYNKACNYIEQKFWNKLWL